MGELFNEAFTRPTVNILLFFHTLFNSMGLPGAFGFSIVALTITIRLLLNPFFKKQTDMTRKMQEMKPEIDALGKKYKNDKQKLQQEQLKLYQQHGINPAGGCLFAIIQFPVFISLYTVIQMFVTAGNGKEAIAEINKQVYSATLKVSTLDPHFLGLNLAATPSQFSKYGVLYLAIPIITGILQYYQIKLATPDAPKQSESKDGKKKEQDMQSMMATQMKIMFPLMIGYFSFSLPVGLSIYWNIFSLFSIIQYRKANASRALVTVKTKK